MWQYWWQELSLKLNRDALITAQQNDPSLTPCFKSAVTTNPPGHLGVNKIYHQVLHNFFWPLLKADVVAYWHSLTTCQLVGKPTKQIPHAPLHLISGEPFKKVILDFMGPLSTKSRHQYILRVMCSATRFSEAIPLCTLTAKMLRKALSNFFSTFWLPKIVQIDQTVCSVNGGPKQRYNEHGT